jgi:hypothetical protein
MNNYLVTHSKEEDSAKTNDKSKFALVKNDDGFHFIEANGKALICGMRPSLAIPRQTIAGMEMMLQVDICNTQCSLCQMHSKKEILTVQTCHNTTQYKVGTWDGVSKTEITPLACGRL